VSAVDWIVLLVAVQRLSELVYANHNQKRLLAQGGVEHGAGHYPLFIILHAAWLVTIWIFADPAQSFDPTLLGAFLALHGLRVWIVLTLGRFWTTRIISVPGVPLIRRGPYRLIRHPNYVVVILEIAVLPMVFGLWRLALVF
jgi:methyltransferase